MSVRLENIQTRWSSISHTMTNPFAKLPNEIFDLILTSLEEKHNWLMLARSCRLLNDRITQLLYDSIETQCYCVGLHKTLVYTFLNHPERGPLIWHLRIGRLPFHSDPEAHSVHQHEYYDGSNSKESLVQPFAPRKDKLEEIIHSLTDESSERGHWKTDLRNGTHRDLWLAILIFLLPNLTNPRTLLARPGNTLFPHRPLTNNSALLTLQRRLVFLPLPVHPTRHHHQNPRRRRLRPGHNAHTPSLQSPACALPRASS